MFIPSSNFLPNGIRSGTYPKRGAPVRGFTPVGSDIDPKQLKQLWYAPDLTDKQYTSLESPARDKLSNLFDPFISN
jgi:hypothetical protein